MTVDGKGTCVIVTVRVMPVFDAQQSVLYSRSCEVGSVVASALCAPWFTQVCK